MPMTTQQVQQIFRAVLSGWPTQRQKMTSDDIRGMAALYTAGLIDLDYAVADAAIARCVRTEEWMPTVAKIRAACVIVTHGERATGAEAWGEVVAMMRKHGWNHAPGIDFQFKDVITDRIVRAFGWSDLCHAEGAAHTADRARFIEAYDQMVESERTTAAATPGIAQPSLPPPLAVHQLERGRTVLSPEERKSILDELVEEAKRRHPELDLGVTPTAHNPGVH